MERKIYITYGTVIEKMTEELLEAVNAAALIGQKNSKGLLRKSKLSEQPLFEPSYTCENP